MTTRIGFIGLGNIGEPMAANLVRAGYDVMVHDLREEPVARLVAMGAKRGGSAKELAAHGEIVELVVMDDEQVEALILGPDGVLCAAAPGTIIAIHSTVLPDTVRKIGRAASGHQVAVVDAQISGGAFGATNRTLSYMVGGDKAPVERCRPVFATSGKKIFHLGPLGCGAAMKLAHQLVSYVNMLATSEGIRLAEAAGIDLQLFCEVMHESAGQSRATDNWLQRSVRRNSDPARPDRLRTLIEKDLRLALALAEHYGLAAPAGKLAQERIDSFM